ncbi:MAG TPA: AI-2E family transporter [Planctomycetaceae bacterium]|nr:AI-2E family transporter [Planctomycetaceae bacterium]
MSSALPHQFETLPALSAVESRDDTSRSGEQETRENRFVRSSGSSFAIKILATLAVFYTIFLAKAIVMPLVMAIVLALLLRPVLRQLRKYHIPDSFGAGAILTALILLLGWGSSYLAEPAREWIAHAPAILTSAGEKLNLITDQLKWINETSERVEDIASGNSEPENDSFPFAPEPEGTEPDHVQEEGGGERSGVSDRKPGNETAPSRPDSNDESPRLGERGAKDAPIPVEVKSPQFRTGLAIFSTTGNLLSQLFIILVLAYFLLAWGDVLLNNILRSMTSHHEKRRTVELVHSVEHGISTYLFTVAGINIGLGCAIGTAMWLLGMPNPALWGVMATLFNFIPYLGAFAGVSVVFVVALLFFDSLSYAFLIPLVYFLLTALEGNFITPLLLGRSMSLNPILIILSLLFWSWMWGVGGAILAVPLLAIFKVGFDQFERTRPLGVLLGGGD